MEGVGDNLVSASHQCCDALVQLIEADCVVAGIAPGRLQPQPSRMQLGDRDQGQPGKPDQRHLLGHLVKGGTADGEHLDPVAAIDAAVAQRVGANYLGIEFAAAHYNGVAVLDESAFSQSPQFHVLILVMRTDSGFRR